MTPPLLGSDSRQGLGIFLFTTVSVRALELSQPPVQRVQGALSLDVKRPGQRSRNEWRYISTIPLRLHGVVLSFKEDSQGLHLYLYLLSWLMYDLFVRCTVQATNAAVQ
jgi:hypothetical protein